MYLFKCVISSQTYRYLDIKEKHITFNRTLNYLKQEIFKISLSKKYQKTILISKIK